MANTNAWLHEQENERLLLQDRAIDTVSKATWQA